MANHKTGKKIHLQCHGTFCTGVNGNYSYAVNAFTCGGSTAEWHRETVVLGDIVDHNQNDNRRGYFRRSGVLPDHGGVWDFTPWRVLPGRES